MVSVSRRRLDRRRTALGAGLFALCATAAAGADGTCTLYATGFDAFAGPPNLALGPFLVQWCLNGAAVSTTNVCPSGTALKLDAATDDPVLFVHVGDAPCASISISFRYGQFAATNTVLRAGFTNATTIDCTPSTPTVLGTLSTTGGACTQVDFTVPLGGAKGLVLRFDHGQNSNAITIDDLVVSITDCCSSVHSCCETGVQGCSDAAVEQCVCAVDPFCCATAWDAQCVALVESLGCGSCDGGGGGECLTTFATDFGTVYIPGSICSLFPELFESCEGTWPVLTISGQCAASGDPALRFGTGFPHSAAITRCIDLTATIAPALRFRFARDLGTIGPRIDYRIDGGPWFVAWQPASGQGIGTCAEIELDLAPIAGEPNVQFRFTSASSLANGTRFDDIALVSTNVPHDCCTEGTAGCTDSVVEGCTCALDPYCCTTEWDGLCVELATVSCGAGCAGVRFCGASDAGDCRAPQTGPYCADAVCCGSICSFDPFCCEVAWDDTCALEAIAVCDGAICGVGAQGCTGTSPLPGCDDPACCTEVCIPDPVCCLVAWDGPCAAAAASLCGGASGPDLDGDGRVDAADLAILLAAWGTGAADLDGSGVVDAADLAVLLAAWTPV
jgi:hypothetical protein